MVRQTGLVEVCMSCLRSAVAVVVFGLVVGCEKGEPEPVLVCPTGPAPGTVSVFAKDIRGTEGIAFTADGRLFVTSGDDVIELDGDGSQRKFATVPKTVGMAAWNNALYVASGEDGSEAPGGFCAETRKGAVYRVDMEGKVTRFATGIRQPNFVTVTPWNTLLVSDDCAANKNIYEINAAGETSVWLDSVASANGMAFSPANDSLFVATTFVNPPPVYQVKLGADHKPQAPTEFFTYENNTSPDGLAIDHDGNIYVALNVMGVIHKLSPKGEDTEFAGGMDTPASMAFGVGTKFDPCSMYVTSLFGSSVYKVRTGIEGAPLKR